MDAGRLKDRVELQQRATGRDTFGGQIETWTAQYQRAASLIHAGGSEAVEAARLAGREIYRMKLRSDSQTRAITTDGWRLRDVLRDSVFNIVSVDTITDRAYVWLRIEGPVAVSSGIPQTLVDVTGGSDIGDLPILP